MVLDIHVDTRGDDPFVSVLPDSARDDLMRGVVSFQALDKDLPRIRVLLLGPAGAGKSSFVVSARSIMYNRVVHLPIIGKAAGGFTKRLMSYEIRAEKGGCPTALSLCDAMSVGDGCSVGLCLSDALAVVKGHVPEGYKVSPISDKVKGYRAAPSLKEQVHCILFVLSASEVGSYPDSLGSALRELHCEVSDLCVPQLILLTHIDEVCHAVHEDVKYVYSSRTLQETIEKAAELVQMPVSSVMPVKNYTSEHSVTCNVDILLLDAIRHILNAVDDMLEDQFPAANETFKVEPLKPL
uniref:G domain-containing protein n=1 Tax=Electrophorus electricus TaxID=8005 RepID=A0AAY5EHR6_ELEEL